ncbi:MAG: AI-2E family transporter [Pikeienuella sp.]
MTVKEQAKWWGVGLVVFIALLMLLSEVLTPFLLGAAIAYFADPIADKLQTRGISRVWSTVIITVAALLVAIIMMILAVPLIIEQVQLAIKATPGIIGGIKDFVELTVLPKVGPDLLGGTYLSDALSKFQGQLQELSARILSGAWSVTAAGFQIISVAVITPVVAFYLLLDWDNMIARIDDLLPRHHAATIRSLSTQVDRVLAGFVRGQLTVCLILGAFYALGLIIVQLPFGLLVGVFAGLISFIPFVGSILGGALSIGIALVHFWDEPHKIVIVAIIFGIGQAVEGNVLSPKLVGGSVGLHPVWLMFSLSAFGALFGFAGLLVAVPAAAVIGVFLRFSVSQYKESRLYQGGSESE